MLRRWMLVALGACGPVPLASPPAPASKAAPVPSSQVRSPASSRGLDTAHELVARCATEAVELLGWNPVPDGAHHGQVIATSLAHGGSADCTRLVDDANTFWFQLDGSRIDWDWGPKDQPDATTIHFTFSCAGCRPIETQVELPRRWYCFGWMHMQYSGTVCEPDHAACENARSGHVHATPCSLHTGAAWCQVHTQHCADSPWSCANSPTRAACEKVP